MNVLRSDYGSLERWKNYYIRFMHTAIHLCHRDQTRQVHWLLEGGCIAVRVASILYM